MNDQESKYNMVIGVSAGGFHSVFELLTQLKPDMDAAIFVHFILNFNPVDEQKHKIIAWKASC